MLRLLRRTENNDKGSKDCEGKIIQSDQVIVSENHSPFNSMLLVLNISSTKC